MSRLTVVDAESSEFKDGEDLIGSRNGKLRMGKVERSECLSRLAERIDECMGKMELLNK